MASPNNPNLEPWQIALIVLATVLVGLFLLYRLALLLAVRSYRTMVRDNAVSVDEFVNRGKRGVEPSQSSCLKCVLLNWFNVGGREAGMEGLELVVMESDHVPGLKVTKRKGASNVGADAETVDVKTSQKADELPPLVVGTIRMGFGHHRIAYAATSWGLAAADGDDGDGNSGGRQTYFHDLLNIESAEATMIHDADKMYSKGSRIASEMGGVIEKFWGSLTKSGDEDSLRATYQMAEHLRPIIGGLDRDSPIVASHSLVAAAAVAAGFTNVINLVIDNHAQWFVVVPGALNLVQGPTNYAQFLKWGVPPSQLGLAGHWIPRDLVEGVPDACARRIARVNSDPRKPLRLLIPVGGAGAQRKFVCALLEALAPLVRDGRVQLFLNAGDHAHMKEAFMEVLDSNKLDYDIVPDISGVRAFKDNLLKDGGDRSEPRKAVTLFAFDEYFTAVATTDILCNVADVLAVKPSELAFYPIPKLMIRRVGDHEEYSALRASELGDGTLEARTVSDAMEYVNTFLTRPELLTEMNRAIEKNASIGIYDGCKNAIRIALERAEEARRRAKEEENKGQ